MTEEIRTFKNIQDAVMDRADLDDTPDNRRQVKEKINTTYLKVIYAEPYRWIADTKPFKMPARYTTGTVTVTNGSNVITGSGTSWTEFDHLNAKIKLGSDNVPRKIVRVASATELTIDSEWTGTTASSTSYTIYKDEFGLFPDLQDIRWLHVFGQRGRNKPTPESPTFVNDKRTCSPFYSGTPRYYTIEGYNYYKAKTWATFLIDQDYWEDNPTKVRPKNPNLIVWPGVRTTDLTVNIRYTKIVNGMTSDADEPIIPYINRHVLVWGTLYDHFLGQRDVVTKREWKKEFDDQLKMMTNDIETTDDEFSLVYDRRSNAWQPAYYNDYEND